MDQTTQANHNQPKAEPSESKLKAKRVLFAFIASILIAVANLAFSSALLIIIKSFLDLVFVYYLAMAAWIVIKNSDVRTANFKLKTKDKAREKDTATVVNSCDAEDHYDENYTYGAYSHTN